MTDWEVKAVSRDRAGNSLSFCGDEPFTWRVWIHDLVDDIEGGRHSYFVAGELGRRVDVMVVLEDSGKVVRTDPRLGDDLLTRLPRC